MAGHMSESCGLRTISLSETRPISILKNTRYLCSCFKSLCYFLRHFLKHLRVKFKCFNKFFHQIQNSQSGISFYPDALLKRDETIAKTVAQWLLRKPWKLLNGCSCYKLTWELQILTYISLGSAGIAGSALFTSIYGIYFYIHRNRN